MSSPDLRFNRQAGFTLIEALLAIAILATISTIVFTALASSTQAVEAGRASAAREEMVRRVLRLMADELSIGAKEPTYTWVGLNGTQDGQPADTLAFVTIGARPTGPTTRTSDRWRVIYTREGDRLVRVARRNLYGATDESLEQLDLAVNVVGFNVRYYHTTAHEWADEWAVAGKIPTAILLELTWRDGDAPPYTVREWVTVGVS